MLKLHYRSDSLRETILRKAFSGELVEQDPNDEPAAALLKRIKAEKASQTPKRRTRKRKKVAIRVTGRYDATGNVEAQFEPGSNDRVLANKLGISDPEEMDDIRTGPVE